MPTSRRSAPTSTKNVLESKVQAAIIKQLEAAGWYVVKLIQTNKNGIPDLVALKAGRYVWIEVKGLKGVVAPLQDYRHTELRKQGAEVIIARSTDDTKHLCLKG